MIEFIQQQLQNEFLSGGMVLMLLGSAVAIFRRVPGQIYRLLYRRVVTFVDVNDQEEAFYWMQQWLADHPYSKKSRLLTVSTRKSSYGGGPELVKANDQSDPMDKSLPDVYFTPSEGVHLLRFEGHWILLTRIRKEQTGGSGNSNQYWREMFTLQTFVNDRAFLRRLILQAREHAFPEEDQRVAIKTLQYNNWQNSSTRLPRDLDSVVLKKGLTDVVTAEVERFFTSAEWYQDRGIPYQMGYLFYGEPGNGKTSMALALASKFKRDIYLMKVAGIGDSAFRQAMTAVPKHSVVLIEDVDCFFQGRNRMVSEPGMGGFEPELTFSGFLNGLDGVSGSEGRLLIMTTNHLDKLDPALIREGRVDHKVEFPNATKDQARRLFVRFFPGELELSEFFSQSVPEGKCCMAKLQGHLLQYRDDAEAASHFAHVQAVAEAV